MVIAIGLWTACQRALSIRLAGQVKWTQNSTQALLIKSCSSWTANTGGGAGETTTSTSWSSSINPSSHFLAAGTAAKLRHDTAQFVYKSHTISGGTGERGRQVQPQTPAADPSLSLPPGLCRVSCGCPGQLPMKSLAKPNNTQSHFDFGQAAGPTKTYGKRTKKNQKRSEKERRKKNTEKDTRLATYCGVLFAFCFY